VIFLTSQVGDLSIVWLLYLASSEYSLKEPESVNFFKEPRKSFQRNRFPLGSLKVYKFGFRLFDLLPAFRYVIEVLLQVDSLDELSGEGGST